MDWNVASDQENIKAEFEVSDPGQEKGRRGWHESVEPAKKVGHEEENSILELSD